MTIKLAQIREASAEALIKASTSFRNDQRCVYKRAIKKETNESAKWILEMILENATIAEEKSLPLCDDTGIPHLTIEIGDSTSVEGRFGEVINSAIQGINDGLKALPGRPMAVKGSDNERIAQSAGLYEDPSKVASTPLRVKTVPGNKLNLSVLMLGGGPEIRSFTYRIFHHNNVHHLGEEIANWAVDNVGLLGCTPCVPAVGIGRTHYEAACMTLDAMVEGTFDEENELEKFITSKINKTSTGPLGIGGDISALKTFVKVGPQRASGVRIVNLRLGCCYDPRKMTLSLQ